MTDQELLSEERLANDHYGIDYEMVLFASFPYSTKIILSPNKRSIKI